MNNSRFQQKKPQNDSKWEASAEDFPNRQASSAHKTNFLLCKIGEGSVLFGNTAAVFQSEKGEYIHSFRSWKRWSCDKAMNDLHAKDVDGPL